MSVTNAALQKRREDAVPRGVSHATPIYAARAENAELWDVEGKRFIDFAGGIAVLNVGHRHPKVIAAAAAQLERFTHTSFQVAPYENYVELCERLNALAPFKGKAKTLLVNSGAEAVENAIKIARAATGRSAIVAFGGAFHGRTLTTTALTGKVAPYKKSYGPMQAEIYHVPFPAPQLDVTVADSLKALSFLTRVDVDPERIAAVIIEPVQGEGGFYEAPKELLVELRRFCDTHKIVFIVDEVQTGFARTGRMFGIERSGVEPDLVAVAKSLGGGFPIAGVIGRAELLDSVGPGGLGSTYGGSPVSCAASLAVLDVIEEEKLLSRADTVGKRLKERLESIANRNDIVAISGIRGPGAMIAFDIVKSRGSGEPDPEATARVTRAAAAEGLVLLSCGVYANVIRILVPLTVSDEMLDEGIGKLEKALVAARQ
ncbi:4-aminobutyrate aminotransferase / (S)-3-amino-2-methylpropionate transaminase [Rhizobiales bacterium GAS188]|nr:4-aminobutyrate aminotransferase / (S)-3-amino-2-methylpropionate transaminase [Rhizobiales bacterium GAS188]